MFSKACLALQFGGNSLFLLGPMVLCLCPVSYNNSSGDDGDDDGKEKEEDEEEEQEVKRGRRRRR